MSTNIVQFSDGNNDNEGVSNEVEKLLTGRCQPDSPFDALRHVRDDGSEYWRARELMTAAGYRQWRQFDDAIQRASIAIDNTHGESSGQVHIADVRKSSAMPNGGHRDVADYELSRYGAYMTFMNGDPRKPQISAAQSYFAVRTRQAEVTGADQVPGDYAAALEKAAGLWRAHQALQVESRRQADTIAELRPMAELWRSWAGMDGYILRSQFKDGLSEMGIVLTPGEVRHALVLLDIMDGRHGVDRSTTLAQRRGYAKTRMYDVPNQAQVFRCVLTVKGAERVAQCLQRLGSNGLTEIRRQYRTRTMDRARLRRFFAD
ncbi:MAG: hypothetical protein ACRD0P_19650 [Stackebrandtia sp.]